MEEHIVKILDTEYLTPNVKRFEVERPGNYQYTPGQATDISINQPGLKNELRPFTFTSLNDADRLEFMIKIYKGHNGITEKLELLKPGDELILHEVFGTISYKGKGLFIAGGAGITPFIAILRQLKKQNKVNGNILLFGNRKSEDIILHKELKEILGENFINVLEETDDPKITKGFIDDQLLKHHLNGKEDYCYVCGPDKFTSIMVDQLRLLGIANDKIIIEQ